MSSSMLHKCQCFLEENMGNQGLKNYTIFFSSLVPGDSMYLLHKKALYWLFLAAELWLRDLFGSECHNLMYLHFSTCESSLHSTTSCIVILNYVFSLQLIKMSVNGLAVECDWVLLKVLQRYFLHVQYFM